MKHFIESHVHEISTVAKNSSYLTSLGLMFSSVTKYMNENVGVVGGILGITTVCINLYFEKRKDKRDEKYQNEELNLKKESYKRRAND